MGDFFEAAFSAICPQDNIRNLPHHLNPSSEVESSSNLSKSKMNKNRFHFLLLTAVLALGVGSAAAQSVFSDPVVEYTFSLPEEKWTMTVKPSATNPNVEYVYGDRRDGFLTVR